MTLTLLRALSSRNSRDMVGPRYETSAAFSIFGHSVCRAVCVASPEDSGHHYPKPVWQRLDYLARSLRCFST